MPKLGLPTPQVSMLPVVAGLCASWLSRLQSTTLSLLASVQVRATVVDSRPIGLLVMKKPAFCAASR